MNVIWTWHEDVRLELKCISTYYQLVTCSINFYQLLATSTDTWFKLWKPEDGHDPNTATFCKEWESEHNPRKKKKKKRAVEHSDLKSLRVKKVFLGPWLGARIVRIQLLHLTQPTSPKKAIPVDHHVPTRENQHGSQSSYWRIRHGTRCCVYMRVCYQRYLEVATHLQLIRCSQLKKSGSSESWR